MVCEMQGDKQKKALQEWSAGHSHALEKVVGCLSSLRIDC